MAILLIPLMFLFDDYLTLSLMLAQIYKKQQNISMKRLNGRSNNIIIGNECRRQSGFPGRYRERLFISCV
jgi:hypothetical protein